VIKRKKMHVNDKNQYQLIKKYIEEFEEGKLRLDELIKNLEEIIESLKTTEQAEQEWKDLFNNEWWTLEQVYAVALYREEKILDTESHNSVYEAIDNMKSLLEQIE
jgi:hypothetical protein